MGSRRFLAFLTVAIISVGACGTNAQTAEPSIPSSLAAPVTEPTFGPRVVTSPCVAPLTAMSSRSQVLAIRLASMRPLLAASNYDAWVVLRQVRGVNEILVLYTGMAADLAACPEARDLAGRVSKVATRARKYVDVVLAYGSAVAEEPRQAAVDLFNLLPEVLGASEDATAIAESLSLTIQTASGPTASAAPLGPLAPLPTPPPVPTTRPTTAPIAVRGSSGSTWTLAAYNTAVAWEQSMLTAYSTTPTLWGLADVTGCGPGVTPEECQANREEGALELKPIRDALVRHENWMKAHPPATCFKDAYAADRTVAAKYLTWISNWGPYGDVTPEGRQQILSLQEAVAAHDAFFSKLSVYFSDCK